MYPLFFFLIQHQQKTPQKLGSKNTETNMLYGIENWLEIAEISHQPGRRKWWKSPSKCSIANDMVYRWVCCLKNVCSSQMSRRSKRNQWCFNHGHMFGKWLHSVGVTRSMQWMLNWATPCHFSRSCTSIQSHLHLILMSLRLPPLKW